MFNYKMINKPKFKINKNTLDYIFDIISKIVSKTQNWTLNIVFLDDNSIKNLNNKYRKINQTTDVLSFHYFDDFTELKTKDIAWEIIISENKIIIPAKEFWLWEEKEFYKLLIHSVLHIFWYDHEKQKDYEIMQNLEKQIWEEVFDK